MASQNPSPKHSQRPPSDRHAGHSHDGLHPHHHGHHGSIGNLRMALFLNLGFTLIELFGGLYTNSMAILTDALHDLGDSLSLGLSWFLEKYSAKDRDQSYSYGYARFSVLGALINSLVLVVGSVLLLFETIPRLMAPEPANAKGMVVFALVGIAANGAAVLRLRKGDTLNERVVMLHLMEDVLGWAAILIGSIVMIFVDVPILDPILSLAIMTFVLFNVFRSLRQSFRIFLQGTPPSVKLDDVEARLNEIKGVCGVHDLHLWSLDGEYNIATLHLVLAKGLGLEHGEEIKDKARHLLEGFKIKHATIEIEPEGADCQLGEN